MSGFAKLHSRLWDGTLGQRPDVWPLFLFLLAHADRHGRVEMTRECIRDRTHFTLEAVNAALAELEGPDPESRTPDEEGRRIVRLDEHRSWGWRIVNYGLYRSKEDPDDVAERVRRHRSLRNGGKRSVTVGNGKKRSAEAEAEADAEKERTLASSRREATLSARVPAEGVVGLPTTGVNGSAEWHATQEELRVWEEAYPALDIPATIREMRAWLVSNPTNRKTPQGMARFVNRWLSKEQNRGA